jgi:hypothetical protein
MQSISGIPEVPTILVSRTPAIALTVDGKPILAPIEGSRLEKTWLKAQDLAGPWTATTKLPAGMSMLPKAQWSDVLKAASARRIW